MNLTPSRGKAILVAAAVVGALLAAACGGDSPPKVVHGNLTISGAVARFPSPSGNGAVYLTVENSGSDDTLMSTTASLAARAQLHEVVTEGAGSRMQMLAELRIPAHDRVSLRPGSYHIMLMGVTAAPAVGTEFEITLVFEHAGTITVPVAVVDQAAVDELLGDDPRD